MKATFFQKARPYLFFIAVSAMSGPAVMPAAAQVSVPNLSAITNLIGKTNTSTTTPGTSVTPTTGGMQLPGGLNMNSITSQIPGFGNINSAQGLAGMLQNPAVAGTLSGMGGNAAQQGSFLDTLFKGAAGSSGTGSSGSNPLAQLFGSGGSSSPAQMANTALVSQGVAAVAPALSAALGGAGGIGGAIASLAGGGAGLGGAAAAATSTTPATPTSPTTSGGGGSDDSCSPQGCGSSCQKCHTDIPNHYGEVRSEITSEFEKHRAWVLNTYWLEHILPALMLMANQLSTAGIAQVNMIGTLLDAKHQLETQRLMQQMAAEAHKDYQPSEGMCTFGTTVRSLAGSERKSNLAQMAFAQRMNQRQLKSGDVLSVQNEDSDIRSRLKIFTATYCDQADNANGLSKLCTAAVPKPERRNIDVDYTRNIESRLTLDVDFLPPAAGAGASAPVKEDDQDVFALSANLFSHNITPEIKPERLATTDGKIRESAVGRYMDLRAVFAKRSVAQNSFAALTAMRASGDAESAPYTKALIKELGVEKDDEIEKFLGKNPSYFAQMEVLTKKLYQSPLFYTELYDKPTNVERKAAALQAIGLMQDRDYYNSLLRSEAVLSVLLETMLQREQEKVVNAMGNLKTTGGTQ